MIFSSYYLSIFFLIIYLCPCAIHLPLFTYPVMQAYYSGLHVDIEL